MGERINRDEAQDLVERAVRNAHASRARLPRWAHVMAALAVGSTRAKALCGIYGMDPDECVGVDSHGDGSIEDGDADELRAECERLRGEVAALSAVVLAVANACNRVDGCIAFTVAADEVVRAIESATGTKGAAWGVTAKALRALTRSGLTDAAAVALADGVE